LKIEIDVKEFATLLDYLKGQRDPTYNVKNFADAILLNVSNKSSEHFNCHT
jgi:hypothetical protein